MPLAVVLAVLAAGYGTFNWFRGNGQLTACQSNLYGLRSALRCYARDHGGHYPIRLDDPVFEKYHGQVPECPAAERDTYSQGYEQHHKIFTIVCQGDNHRHFLPGPETSNFPSTGSESGLRIGPW